MATFWIKLGNFLFHHLVTLLRRVKVGPDFHSSLEQKVATERNEQEEGEEKTFAQFIIQLNKQKEAKVDEKGPNQMIVLAQTPLSRDGD